jgi:delta-aminolevulinic acid dehydratase/porphobilinogen synthase
MENYFEDEPKELMRAEVNSKILNGREIKYLDVVKHHTTGVKFGFWERIKILFGIPFDIHVDIYTTHGHCNVVGGETDLFVRDWFKKKPKQMSSTPGGVKQ